MATGSFSDGGFIPSIPQFYSEKNILITGVTGFMGKVLLEKLLRSCPQVGKIYMIIRDKKGKNPYHRLKEITDLPLYDVLKSEQCWSDVEKKLVLLSGDILELNLGLSEEDYQTLINNVSIVFHVAASVRFDDDLTQAVKMNTRGTREVAKLCLKMKFLKVLLHVSTTYSNCDRDMIDEQMYPPHMDWKDAIDTVEKLDAVILNILSKKYLGGMPNTYTLTKSMAENVIWEYRTQIPIIILRPSIVISSWKDPFPGWLDNVNGPIGMLIGGGKGVVRTCLADPDVVADYMPVDIAIRAIIIAVWHHSVNRIQDESKLIYNCSSTVKSVPMKEIMTLGFEAIAEYPFTEVLWTPGTNITKNKLYFTVSAWFTHLIPAIIIDAILTARRKKPMLVRLQQRIFQAILALSYFTMNQWTFNNTNFQNLNTYLLPEDKLDFDIDLEKLDAKEYFFNATLGARSYLLHEDDSRLPEARIKAKRMYWVDKILRTSFVVLLIWYLNCQSWVLNTFQFLYSYINFL